MPKSKIIHINKFILTENEDDLESGYSIKEYNDSLFGKCVEIYSNNDIEKVCTIERRFIPDLIKILKKFC